MNNFEASDKGLLLVDAKLVGENEPTVRSMILEGFHSVDFKNYGELFTKWYELTNCYAVQMAIDVENTYIKLGLAVPDPSECFDTGLSLLRGQSVEGMARYICESNPVFWNDFIADHSELHSLM